MPAEHSKHAATGRVDHGDGAHAPHAHAARRVEECLVRRDSFAWLGVITGQHERRQVGVILGDSTEVSEVDDAGQCAGAVDDGKDELIAVASPSAPWSPI